MMTNQLNYTSDELMRDHDGLEPHVVSGQRLHGGFHPDGTYQPPRALVRETAFDAWTEALHARGGTVFPADSSLLTGPRLPNAEQQRVLLRNGLGQTFFDMLTITGKIEARGRILADIDFPDLQPAIVDDISDMAIGHLGKGLLVAHGIDEGGEPESGIGGHDAMWFIARDLVFDDGAFPDAAPPENIARPDAGTRMMPELAPEIEGLLSLLTNLLLIEFRAEIGFADTQAILRTPDLFTDRRDDAELAAEIVERIRTDEEIHVRSLCLYLGELCSVDFRTVDGATIGGRDLIERFWSGLVRWATLDQPALNVERVRPILDAYIATHSDAARVDGEFAAAADHLTNV